MRMYPNVDVDKKNYPLQSLLFGHRIQPSQTKYEYLIEFLQVAIAEKQGDPRSFLRSRHQQCFRLLKRQMEVSATFPSLALD